MQLETLERSDVEQHEGATPSKTSQAEPQLWYAVHTQSRHEKKVAAELAERSINAFVPTIREVRKWSDRRKVIDVPMFSCYVFVRVSHWQQAYSRVLHTPGVFRWVSSQREPTPIPECQIDAVRSMMSNGVPISPYPFLNVGQRVRIRGGCLHGVEGILVEQDRNRKLVVSVELIQQSVAVSVEGYDVEAA